MKLTNTKRALMGATAVLVLGAILIWRRGGGQFGQSDGLLIGAALLLVAMNVAGSYYFDRKGHQEGRNSKV